MKKQKKPFITRARMFIAAGSLAGLVGGWAMLAQADASTAATNSTAIVQMAPAQTTDVVTIAPAATTTATKAASTSTSTATATKVTATTTLPKLRTRSS